jgi:hypothetical protein
MGLQRQVVEVSRGGYLHPPALCRLFQIPLDSSYEEDILKCWTVLTAIGELCLEPAFESCATW